VLAKGSQTILKGTWSDHVNHLNFGGHQSYLWNGGSEIRQISYTGRIDQVLAMGWQSSP